MKNITIKNMIKNSNIPAALIQSTIKQLGGFDEFKLRASDIVKYDANNGESGFTYYTETVEFTKKNKVEIMDLAEYQANNLYDGSDAYVMIAGFNYLQTSSRKDSKPLYSPGEIAAAIHGRYKDDNDQIFDALAKYALEELARLYCYLTEQD